MSLGHDFGELIDSLPDAWTSATATIRLERDEYASAAALDDAVAQLAALRNATGIAFSVTPLSAPLAEQTLRRLERSHWRGQVSLVSISGDASALANFNSRVRPHDVVQGPAGTATLAVIR